MKSKQNRPLTLKVLLPFASIFFVTVGVILYYLHHSALVATTFSALLTISILLALYLFLRLRVLNPLSQIKEGAELFANEDFNHPIPLSETREFAELAELLNQMAKTVQRHDQIRKDFVANVSHELKTPITSIKGYLEMLTAGALNDPENGKKFLGIVSAQTERLIAIIDDLLALSYLESSNRERVETEDVYLSEIIERVVQYNTSSASKKKIDIVVEVEESITLKGNPLLFDQMIGNLLENAIKYSEDDTKIQIIVTKEQEKLKIRVSDEGRGIASHHLDRIFERFYRVDKARSRNAGGTGLGLAIVKHIAQMHGGAVSVESKVGQGSSFTITFSG
ncbi:HAMP domain-containing protein [bacterium]|nr:HAMP domain-containing protein [bacterium]